MGVHRLDSPGSGHGLEKTAKKNFSFHKMQEIP